MSSNFTPKTNNSSKATQRASPRSDGSGFKGAFNDSLSTTWRIARSPRMWLAFPASVIALLVLISSAANLGFKSVTGEKNSLPVTADGIISGSAYGVRSIFGATRDQIEESTATVENPYNQPISSPSPSPSASPEAATEPLQPNVQ